MAARTQFFSDALIRPRTPLYSWRSMMASGPKRYLTRYSPKSS